MPSMLTQELSSGHADRTPAGDDVAYGRTHVADLVDVSAPLAYVTEEDVMRAWRRLSALSCWRSREVGKGFGQTARITLDVT